MFEFIGICVLFKIPVGVYVFVFYRQRNFQTVSLTKIQEFIDMGRLKVKEGEMITMRDLYMAGIATGIDDGIKLLAGVRHSHLSFRR
jgi:hypothetical protein